MKCVLITEKQLYLEHEEACVSIRANGTYRVRPIVYSQPLGTGETGILLADMQWFDAVCCALADNVHVFKMPTDTTWIATWNNANKAADALAFLAVSSILRNENNLRAIVDDLKPVFRGKWPSDQSGLDCELFLDMLLRKYPKGRFAKKQYNRRTYNRGKIA